MELGDDCPPSDIWLDTDALETWFEAVKSGNGKNASESEDDDEESDMMDLDDPLLAMWRNG